MSEPAKRKFWQLHLSTAIYLAILAGGLLWIETTVISYIDEFGGITDEWHANYEVGFPLSYYRRSDWLMAGPHGGPATSLPEKSLLQLFVRDSNLQQEFSLLYFIVDLIFVVLVLLLAGGIREWQIRRRAAGILNG